MLSKTILQGLLFVFITLCQYLTLSISQHQQQQTQQQNQTKSIDDLLHDTNHLLDILDRKVSSVANKTTNALMRDSLRLLLDEEQAAEVSSSNQDNYFNENDNLSNNDDDNNKNNNEETDSSSFVILPLVGDDGLNLSSKRARQISLQADEQFVASDSTERHIKFTLDLMHSIFETQAYTSKTQLIDSFLISPLSLQIVLMLMHLGARGQTRRELNTCLHLSSPSSSIEQLTSSSSSSSSPSSSSLHVTSANIEPKLIRRNQQNYHQQHTKQAQQSNVNVHELFGSAVRNLLKDPNVIKAFSSANQIFLQKNIALSQQYEQAIKHFYNADVKFVDFQQTTGQHSFSKTQATTSDTTNDQITSAKDSLASSDQTTPTKQINNNNNNSNNSNSNNAQTLINDWVEKQTRGHISNFLSSPVSTSTLMMAINVLFFKGDWKYKFDPADTQTDAWFTRANGELVKIPMMVNKLPIGFAHDSAMKTSVIELPYKAQRLGLFLLLPDEVSGIFHTMKMLNSSSFANLISSMRKPSSTIIGSSATNAASAGINVRIPKFKIDSSPRLTQILSQKLGLKSLFSPDSADLSAMFAPANKKTTFNTNNHQVLHKSPSTNQNYYTSSSSIFASNDFAQNNNTNYNQAGLDELLQKAVFQVDESGSVAAASSATIVERVGLFNNNYFEADHPFLLFLMDKQTGLVLFSGAFAGNSNNNNNK